MEVFVKYFGRFSEGVEIKEKQRINALFNAVMSVIYIFSQPLWLVIFLSNPFFGHNSLSRALIGTRIGGNGSYQPPGAP